MKKLFLPLCLLAFIIACNKDTPFPSGNGNPPPVDSTNQYAGDYAGLFYQHVAGVDSNGVYKSDTTYAYTVTVEYAGPDKITIHGQTNIEAITVNDSGYFEFNDYKRNIEGQFKGDSLHIFSDAISGTYEPPQFYNNTQMTFDGKKLQ